MSLNHDYEDYLSSSDYEHQESPEGIEHRRHIRRLLEDRLERKHLREALSDDFEDEFDWSNVDL